MRKYFIQKIGCTEFEDTVLIGEVNRMKKNDLLPINNCEQYIVNKGELVVYINGVLYNIKKRAQNNLLIYDTYKEALENYIRLENMKIKEIKEESDAKIKNLSKERINNAKEKEKLL